MRLPCAFLGVTLLAALPAHAYDPFADQRAERRFVIAGPDGLALVIKGQAAMAFVDLEGAGGLGRDSVTDTVTLGTRSAHGRLDGVVLAPRLEAPEGFRMALELAFDANGAQARAAWLEARFATTEALELRAEAGFQRPLGSVDPRLRRSALASRAWLDAAELHLVGEAILRWPPWQLAGATSVAMLRPLGSTGINDASARGTLALIAAQESRPYSGNGPAFGARLRLGYGEEGPDFWGRLEGFGAAGTLAAEGGIDELRNRIAGFSHLPGFNTADPRDQDTTTWWVGGRLDVGLRGFEARAEWVEARDSLLRRRSALVQGGYAWMREAVWLSSLELRVRGERYRLLDADPLRVADPSQALTWDWDVLTVEAGAWLYRRLLRITVEHSVLADDRSGPEFANNESLAQLELRF